jgi:hypothetical protein
MPPKAMLAAALNESAILTNLDTMPVLLFIALSSLG